MRSERLVILVSPEEKARLRKLARRSEVSVAELVRSELPLSGGSKDSAGQRRDNGEDALSEGEMAILDRAAEALVDRTRRANQALDRALGELGATKSRFASRHRAEASEGSLKRARSKPKVAKPRSARKAKTSTKAAG